MIQKLFTICLLMLSIAANAQSIKDVEYVEIQKKYAFQDHENEYLINTSLKHRFQELGYKVYFMNDEVPEEVKKNPCKRVRVVLDETKRTMSTKLNMYIRDCNENIVATTSGESRAKNHRTSYREALDLIFKGNTLPHRAVE